VRSLSSVALVASSVGGEVLGAATRVVSARRAAKPLHPDGSVVPGTLRRFGDQVRTGAAWLDDTGEDEVLVRRSRAVGLAAPLPDVVGLAVRVPLDTGEYGDLLFASTGLGRLSRFTLTPTRSPYRRALTTLLPYRVPAGPLLLCVLSHDDQTLDLAWAVGVGSWHRFAELRIRRGIVDEGDLPLSFDPIRNVLPGLENYGWVRRLREPAYATARSSRGS
jgi:hypothetical protein